MISCISKLFELKYIIVNFRVLDDSIQFLAFFLFFFLKGKSQGHNAIFKGLKIAFRTKIVKKKLYHVNQHQKFYKLCFDNFSLRPLFILAVLLITVNFTKCAAIIPLSDAPRTQDYLSKLLTALSA